MTLPDKQAWLFPDWRPHPRVHACITTRVGNFSPAPWQGFNLGLNCNDDPARVGHARQQVAQQLALHRIGWLTQVHGTRVVTAGNDLPDADASLGYQPGIACAILTADCLPVLFARTDGTAVAAAHAGWRGLADGVLINTVQQLAPQGESVSAWLGPAICQTCYQVDDTVRNAFLAQHPGSASAFLDDGLGHYRLSLTHAAIQQLNALNVDVTPSHLCTSCHNDRFYSYRKEQGRTGRFASLVWLS